jgi:hypothetical protein
MRLEAVLEQRRASQPQMSHPASWSVDRLLAQCSVARTRRSGPGGQHRNKVETAVVITHRPTGVRAEASEQRSQAANLARATFRLRVKLALCVRTLPEAAPTSLWSQRVAGRRMTVNPLHASFPALLAEALDVLAVKDWAPAAAGEFLGVSGSQIMKLLKLEPEALMLLNRERRKLGLPACR